MTSYLCPSTLEAQHATLQQPDIMEQPWGTGVCFILILIFTLSGAFWLPGREVVYKYHAHLDASTLLPAQAMSQWALKGKLVVQGDQDTATLQLQDMTVSSYNGPSQHDTPTEETPPPEEATQLLQPFLLHFENGQLVDLSVKAGEDVWSVNMKRGLAGLLQLDPTALDTAASIKTENGLYGQCRVEYATHNYTNGTVSVSKSLDLGNCLDHPSHTLSSASRMMCPTGFRGQHLDTASVRGFTLQPLGPTGELIITSAIADGGTYYQPFHAQSEAHYIWTWMELELEKEGPLEAQIGVKGGGEKVGLRFELISSDVSQGRSPPSQEKLVKAITSMLRELGDSMEPPGLELNLTRLHEERIAYVLYFLSLLNHTNFNQLYSELAVGTSYQHETFRNLFMELLPLIGSNDALLLIRDLVMSGTLKNDTSVELLSALPFTIRNPTEQLLKEFEVLLTIPEDSVLYNTAILTFATLVNRVCKNNNCAPDTVDKYVGQYLDSFAGSDSYQKQLLYLQALGNFNLESIALYLKPIIKGGNPKYSQHIRFLSVWATLEQQLTDPESYQTYWPILSNPEEDLQMRVAALTVLMLSEPFVPRFFRLMSFMLEEENPHLRHFWHSTLQSLLHSDHPCYAHLTGLVKKAVRFFPEPPVHHWATGNYILDYNDMEHGFGSLAQLFLIANPNTGLPSVFFLDFSSHTVQHSYNQYSVYVRLDGIGDLLRGKLTKTTLSVNKLMELLKQLELPTKGSEPVHVELIVKVQRKVVLVHYANQTTFSSLFQVLNNVQRLASGGVHINAQNIVLPFLLEELRVTDVGTTAMLRVSNSWMMSARANLTAGKQISNELELRSYLSSQTALTNYNPVLNVWHGVYRSLNLHTNLPFNLHFSLDSQRRHLKFSFQQKPGEELGVVAHVRTVVSVRGISAATKLKSHCSTCPDNVVVTANTDHPKLKTLAELKLSDAKFQLALLDCEHSYQKEDLITLLHHITDHQNFNVFPAVSPILTLIHLYDSMMLVPPSGSCGILAKLSDEVEEPKQVQVEIILNGRADSGNSSLDPIPAGTYRVQVILSDNSSARWSIDTQYSHSSALSQHWLLTKLLSDDTQVASINLNASFPEPSAEVSFLSEVEPHTATVDVTAEWGKSSIQLTMDADVPPEQQSRMTDTSVWPYSACHEDLDDVEQWGERYAPLTLACFEVAKELSTLRRYNFTVTSTHLPKWMKFLHLENANAQLEVPQTGKAVAIVNGRRKLLSSSTTTRLQPWLVNTQFPPILQFATYMGAVGSCVMTLQSAWTLDGANINVTTGNCYSLALADCSETPQYAIFMKKGDVAKNPMAIKVYSGDNIVELLPTGDNVTITINGNEVDDPQKGYQYPPEKSTYDLKVWQRSDGLIRVHVAVSHIWLEYYGHFATVTVLGVYHGKLCGLCGDHNGVANDDTSQTHSLPCAA